MNCGGYLFNLARVTAGPGRREPGFALKGTRPEAWPLSPGGGLRGLIVSVFPRGRRSVGQL